MALAVVSKGIGSTTDNFETDLGPFSCASGSTLVVFYLVPSGEIISAVTWNGHALTQVDGVDVSSFLSVWKLENTPAESGFFAATTEGNDDVQLAGAYEVTGAGTSPAVDVSTTNSGTGTTPSTGTTAATAQANEVALACVVTMGPSSDDVGAWSGGYVALDRVGVSNFDSYTMSTAYLVLAATGAQSASKSGISQSRPWVGAIVTVKGAAAAPSADVADSSQIVGSTIFGDDRAAASRQRARGARSRTRARVLSGVSLAGYETYERSTSDGCPVECYLFTSGATAYRYTSADEPIVLSTGTYAPTVVIRDGADFSAEDTTGNITVRIPRNDPVALLGVAYVPPSPVTLTVYRKHRGDPETIVYWQGRVVSWAFDGPECSLTCAPISQVFRRRVPSILFESQCNWALYGSGCTVAKVSFKDSGTVSAVDGVTVRAVVFGTRPAGWYTNGWVELASGERRFVVDHVGDAVTIMSAFSSLSVGAAVDAYAGCDRTEAVCAAKFNNLVNHLGFPRIPTRNPFGGSIT